MIPNQNNLADILKSVLDSTQSIVTQVEQVCKLVNNSNLINKQTVSNTKVALINMVKVIRTISDSLLDINTAMSEAQATIKSIQLAGLFSDPKSMMQFVKTHELSELNYKNSFFDQYLYLLGTCNTIAEYSAGIKPRDIKKSKKLILALISSVIDVYVDIYKHSLSSKLFSISGKFVDTVEVASNKILDLMANTLQKIKEIIQSNSLDRKEIKRTVKNLFVVQNAILWESFLLSLRIKLYGGKNVIKNLSIFIGISIALGYAFEHLKVVIDEVVKIASVGNINFAVSIKMVRYMFNSIIKTFTSYSLTDLPLVILTLFVVSKTVIPIIEKIFEDLTPVIDQLIVLGDNFVKANLGVYAVEKIFKGENSVISTVASVTVSQLMGIMLAVPVAFALGTIFSLLTPVVKLLSEAGKNYLAIRRGIRAVNLIMNGKRFLFYKKDSLITILSSLGPEDFAKLTKALPTVVLLTIIMSAMMVVMNSLILAGRNSRKIRRGIRVMIYVINKLSTLIFNINARISVKASMEAAAKIVIMLALIPPLTLMIASLGLVSVLALGAIATIAGIIIVMGGLILLVQLINADPKLPQGIGKLIYLATAMTGVAASLAIISEISFDWKKITLFALTSALLILTYVGLVWIIKKIPGTVSGVLMMILVIGAMYVSALVIGKMSEINVNYKNIGDLALALLIISGVVILLGLLAIILPIALIGTLLMAVEITMITLIAVEIIILSKINISDLEKAKENVKKIFDISSYIVEEFLYNTTGGGKKEGESWMLTTLKYIGGPVAYLAEAILSSLFIATTMITITMVLLIAAELRIIQEINLDKAKIEGTISNVLEIVAYLINTFNGSVDVKKSGEDQGVWGSLMTYVFRPLGSIIEAIFSMAYLAVAVINVTCLLFLAGQLRLIQEINLDQGKITTNIGIVIGILSGIHAAISTVPAEKTSEKKGWFRKALSKIPILSNAVDLVEAISNFAMIANGMLMIGMIHMIVKNLNDIQTIDLNQSAISSKVDDVIRICNVVSEKVNDSSVTQMDDDKISSFGTFTTHIIKLIGSVNDLKTNQVKPFVEVIDKANSINVDKIKTVTEMFGQMTRFSESLNGNIEDLAKVLSEDLVDALNKLNDAMGGVGETTEKATAVGTSMKQDSKASSTTTPANTTAPVTQKVDLRGVESKLQDIVTKLTKINSNIEDLQ